MLISVANMSPMAAHPDWGSGMLWDYTLGPSDGWRTKSRTATNPETLNRASSNYNYKSLAKLPKTINEAKTCHPKPKTLRSHAAGIL